MARSPAIRCCEQRARIEVSPAGIGLPRAAWWPSLCAHVGAGAGAGSESVVPPDEASSEASAAAVTMATRQVRAADCMCVSFTGSAASYRATHVSIMAAREL